MCTCRLLPALVCCIAVSAWGQQGPDIGVEATPGEVAAWDIGIGPDGEGLPEGSGTALDGAPIYALHCLGCHGAVGSGQLNDVQTLAGIGMPNRDNFIPVYPPE